MFFVKDTLYIIQVLKLFVQLNFAELESGASRHADELEAVVTEGGRGGHLEAVLLLVLVTHTAVVLLFVEGSPGLLVVRAGDAPSYGVAVGVGVCIVACHKAVLRNG